ncbi:hypothetical protein GGQ64_004822 [Rhizobium azooxidifex]|uniref:Uncharacterized protein n=1 Tax=Mycoplana azooxidifex TaxID=1636188 RepID=A0A7W6GLU3_9HYPH|nr:hypothetical protein [Mycoplana azooxidifex]MBB3979578.1 hypothetical protein [Mycoplana azooxidifex]
MDYKLILDIIRERRAGIDAIVLASERRGIAGHDETRTHPVHDSRHDPVYGLEEWACAAMPGPF